MLNIQSLIKIPIPKLDKKKEIEDLVAQIIQYKE